MGRRVCLGCELVGATRQRREDVGSNKITHLSPSPASINPLEAVVVDEAEPRAVLAVLKSLGRVAISALHA